MPPATQLTTQGTARARVAKGAAFLDRTRPGWFTQIDIDTLNLVDGCRCVLAQSYGCRYRDAARLAELADPATPEGERAVIDLGFYEKGVVWAPLEDAWIEAIAARRFPVVEPQDQPDTVSV